MTQSNPFLALVDALWEQGQDGEILAQQLTAAFSRIAAEANNGNTIEQEFSRLLKMSTDKATSLGDSRSDDRLIDLNSPKQEVEVMIDDTGTKLWVNVDGRCRLRIYGIPPHILKLDDRRKGARRDDSGTE